jgi:replication factor A1
MEIKDLKPNQGKVDIVATVKEKDEPRTFEKFGKQGQVCNAKLEDESGTVVLTLWNEDVESIKVGDKVHLQNGWCSEYKGERQVSSGKFGKIEVVQSAAENTVFTNDPNILQPQVPEGLVGEDLAGQPLGEEMSEPEEELFTDQEEIVG